MGGKVCDRLHFYLKHTKNPPQIFQSLSDQLPLLIQTFEVIRKACDHEKIDEESQKALVRTVQGCVRQTSLLDNFLKDCLPALDDSFTTRARKALRSIRAEKSIVEIQRMLEAYKSTLTLYFSYLTVMAESDQSLADAKLQSRYFEVPKMGVREFVGRKYLLDRIQSCFDDGARTARSTIVVLYGMGGSKLAPGRNFSTPEATTAYVLKALEDLKDPILFVFDNFDRPSKFSDVREFLPHQAKIIFTSRHGDSKRLGKTIEVNSMSIDEGVELLLLQSGFDKTSENMKSASSIVHELGGLALAIDQAATYIGAHQVPLNAFLDIYSKRRAAILAHTPSHWEYRKARLDETEERLSVFSTWEMSFDSLEVTAELHDSLIHLLTLSAFMDTAHISEGLFRHFYEVTNPAHPAWVTEFLTDGSWDSDKYQDCIVRLLGVSLVQSIDIMTEDARFSFHQLIAEWLKLRIDDLTRSQYTEEAIQVLRLFVDGGDKKDMSFRDKTETLGHLDKCVENDLTYRSIGHNVSQALMEAMISFGSFYRRLGRHRETRELIERAMNADSHAISPAVRNVLANMYCDQGELEKAEKLYLQVFQDSGQSPPVKETGEPLASTVLGFLFWTQDDKLDKTGESYEGSYAGEFSSQTPWFVAALSTFNGLGLVYLKQGKLAQAEEMFMPALDGREKVQGPEDRYTLSIVDHLGTLYLMQRQFEKAEKMYLRALTGLEEHCGPTHAMTLQTVNNIGLLYLQQRQLAKAEASLHRASHGLEGSFGSAHPSTLTAYHNLGLLYREQGKLSEAQAMFKRALEGWEANALVKPDADSRCCLAELYEGLKEYGQAETLFAQAAKNYEHALGLRHPQTLGAMTRRDETHALEHISRMGV